ncbi:hypothetical protein NI389_03905 [Pseudoalteromonas xiamenensis]|uniref:hypothetical protein n=1 Tax=Pseudoalteromonas xiamenensis TaxID=882626 RepID=UPI0027E4D30E|nr:hypothetical protein [Pseudoalteromonas xiamenensis]WMN60557.1 hypothetical protein NI389_03905 [Pseudoalteromonas xiamenensis]
MNTKVKLIVILSLIGFIAFCINQLTSIDVSAQSVNQSAEVASSRMPIEDESDTSITFRDVKLKPSKSEEAPAYGADVKAITPSEYLPPIAKSTHDEQHYSGNLNDYQAYEAFHHEKDRALKQAYVQAATEKISVLEQLLQKGKEANLPKEQLQEAIDKIEALQELTNKIKSELKSKN